jgi:hypothetical protein
MVLPALVVSGIEKIIVSLVAIPLAAGLAIAFRKLPVPLSDFVVTVKVSAIQKPGSRQSNTVSIKHLLIEGSLGLAVMRSLKVSSFKFRYKVDRVPNCRFGPVAGRRFYYTLETSIILIISRR